MCIFRGIYLFLKIKINKNMKFNKINMFNGLSIIFNKSNFNKVIIIFIFGLVSRVLVGHFYSVNVYLDYLSPVSILYYVFMSAFIVLVHEFIDYFNFSLVPLFSFINEIYTSISKIVGFIVRMLVSMNTRIFSYKLEDIKISSIIKGAKHLFSRDKATLDLNESCTSKSSNKISTFGSKSIKDTYVLEKNDGVSKKILPKGNWSNNVSARAEEVRLRRQQAESIAQNRLRNGLMRNGVINFNANTSSQIGSNRIRNDELRYRESLRLPPILSDEDRSILYRNSTYNNILPTLEPSVSNNNSQAMVSHLNNNNKNNSQTNNNSTDNNQGNTSNNSSHNDQDSTNNSISNSK